MIPIYQAHVLRREEQAERLVRSSLELPPEPSLPGISSDDDLRVVAATDHDGEHACERVRVTTPLMGRQLQRID